MKKLLISIMICVLIITFVNAYDAGDVVDLYKIDVCRGPLRVKAFSENPLKNSELMFDGFKQVTNNEWLTECSNNFLIRFKTDEKTKNEYDFVVQYYIDYKNVEENNHSIISNEEVFNEEHKIVKTINDININLKEKIKTPFSINIKMINVIFFCILFFVFIMIVLYYMVFKKSFVYEKNDDVLNYSVKNTSNNDIKAWFKNIK